MAHHFCRWDPAAKVICLRFSNVMEPGDYAGFASWQDDPLARAWNAWGYIDARDGAQAVRRALDLDASGYDVFIVANSDTVMERPSADLAARGVPGHPAASGPWPGSRRCCRSTRPGGCWASSRSTPGATPGLTARFLPTADGIAHRPSRARRVPHTRSRQRRLGEMMTIRMYGTAWCSDCKRAKQFFAEQRVEYDFVDVDSDAEGRAVVQEHNGGKDIIPTILFDDGTVLVEPSNAELAATLGLQTQAERSFYDLIVVGSGPAGLTAALYAAREGMDVLVVERGGVGGQAGITERLDNFPGFPEGVTGAEFADRLRAQAEKFGVEILSAQEVSAVAVDGHYRTVSTADGATYSGLRGAPHHGVDVPPPRHRRRGRPHRRGRALLRDLRRRLLPRQGRRGHRRRQQRGRGEPVPDPVRGPRDHRDARHRAVGQRRRGAEGARARRHQRRHRCPRLWASPRPTAASPGSRSSGTAAAR